MFSSFCSFIVTTHDSVSWRLRDASHVARYHSNSTCHLNTVSNLDGRVKTEAAQQTMPCLQSLRDRIGGEPFHGLVAGPLVLRHVLLQDAGIDLGEGSLQPGLCQLPPGFNSCPQSFLRRNVCSVAKRMENA